MFSQPCHQQLTEDIVPLPQTETGMMTCQTEVESANCDCCGLTEECTAAYIQRIRERFSGKWICGLCSEAVKDEIARSCDRLISTEEALTRHMSFCKKLSSPPVNSAVMLISAMRRILRRGLESRSVPGSPVKNDETVMIQSKSCAAAVAVSGFGDVEG